MNDMEPTGVQDVRVVVFDLGGVLVQLGGVEQMARLCGGMAVDELWRRWLSCVHWDDQIERGFGLERMFDRQFLSHEIARIKPDPDVYAHVAAELDEPAGSLLFLDDNLLNVEAARQAGWHAEHVRGVGAARAALERHGVLEVTPSAGS